MASIPVLHTSSEFREEFFDRGGENAARCYQCATCSSVCELAPANAPFPRRQILWAQWGLKDRLIVRRRAVAVPPVQRLLGAVPARGQPRRHDGRRSAPWSWSTWRPLPFLGKLVGNVKKTWPLLIFGPLLFWIILLGATGAHIPGIDPALGRPRRQFLLRALRIAYPDLLHLLHGHGFWVPLRYVDLGSKILASARDQLKSEPGPFLGALDSGLHRHRNSTRSSHPATAGVVKRRWGHFFVMWGFIGAAITSGFRGALPVQGHGFLCRGCTSSFSYPVPHHSLGEVAREHLGSSALVVGGLLLWFNRRSHG